MSVEIRFPLEFVVRGTPVASSSTNPTAREAWRTRVRDASSAALPEGHFAADGPITVTLFYFPATQMQGDVDNIVKLVLDAMSRHIYFDDRQVERVWVQKFEPGRIFAFGQPSGILWQALAGAKPLLYVRLGNDQGGPFLMSASARETAALEALVPEMEAEGFAVYLHPQPRHVPEFLKGLRPDAIAYKGDRKVLVEVAREGDR